MPVNIIVKKMRKIEVFIVALLIFGFVSLSFAQDRKIDIDAFFGKFQERCPF